MVHFIKHLSPLAIAFSAILLLPTIEAVAQTNSDKQIFETFPKLRHEILNTISGATERVWISTEFLSDGEIVSALFLAVYRKIDVQVLLGRTKANRYMSRLNYLKKNNVPVFLKPAKFPRTPATAVLADNRLMYLDAELDFLLKGTNYTVVYPEPDEVVKFSNIFVDASGKKVQAYARPVPLVGRPNYHKTRNSNFNRSSLSQPSKPNYNNINSDGSYTYDKKDSKRPAYIPSKLPSGTIWEKKINEAQNSPNGGSN